MNTRKTRPLPPALERAATDAMVAKGRALGGIWTRKALLTRFLEETGLRLAEALKVGRENVTPGGCLRFEGKGRKERLVPVPPDLLAELPAGGRFFPISRTTARRWLKELAYAAGYNGRIFPHLFRATHTTRLLDAGEHPAKVALIEGHADPRTTMVYYRTAEAVLTQAASKAWRKPTA